jgi:hypothetical protein
MNGLFGTAETWAAMILWTVLEIFPTHPVLPISSTLIDIFSTFRMVEIGTC